MPEEVIEANTIQRDAEVAQKPNLDALSNDTFLNEFNHQGEAPKVEEVKPIVEEKKPEEVADESLTLEKPIEEVKEEPVVEEELKLEEETVLSLEDNQLEPEEGTWKFVAKQDGLEIADDSYESFKEALTKPLETKLAELDNKKMEDYFVNLDPQSRVHMELASQGMSYDDIVAPLRDIDRYLGMEPAELFRADLIARNPKASEEWIDTEVELVVADDRRLNHENERIVMELGDAKESIVNERNQLIEKYKTNSENYLNESRAKEIESVTKALNEIPELMGSVIAPETKKILADNMRNGKYDHVFNDPTLKAEFLAYNQLKGQIKKAQEAAIAKSYAKGKLDITKELHNTPPLDKGGAGVQVKQTGNGAFDKLDNEFRNG